MENPGISDEHSADEQGRGRGSTEWVAVNVAVIGESGSGRTSLINCLRRLDDSFNTSSIVKDSDNTTEPLLYRHSAYNDLHFWLLPEIRVASEAPAYLKQVHFEQYHFFIIVFHQILHEIHATLAALLEKAQKPVVFVKTNIDVDLRKAKESTMLEYNEEMYIKEKKKEYSDFLGMQGVNSSQVYVVANIERKKFDLPYLQAFLEEGSIPKSVTKSDSITKETDDFVILCCGSVKSDAVSEAVASHPSENIDVSIAVLGKPGSGKSALINGIRGLSEEDKGAAVIGVEGKVQDPLVYKHPMFPGLRLYEIQVPEDCVPLSQHTEQCISSADIVMVVTGDGFTSDYAAFVKAIHITNKKVYFVKTKVDNEIHTLKRKERCLFDQQEALKEIQEHCLCDLQAFSLDDPKLFLLSSFEPDKFDFHRLLDTLLQDIKERACLNSFDIISDEEIEEIRAAYHTGGLSAFVSKIQSSLDALHETRLDIAITGEPGCGKSTFINALRGLDDEDEAAAKIGITETTVEPTEYPYLRYPNISLWDLPGIGAPNFAADAYLQKINFGHYDFFFILASDCFKENHVILAKEIEARGKNVYFIRTKIDIDIQTEKRKGDLDEMDEKEVLDKIRQNCIQKSEKENFHPEIFLLSSFELSKYDFQLFEETLVKHLTGYKKRIFLMSLPNISREIICKKKEHLQEEAWKIAAISSLVAAVPIPGLSVACDVYVLTKYLAAYQVAFGLDNQSLSKLAEKVQLPIEDLKDQIKSPFGSEVTNELVVHLVKNGSGVGFIFADLLYKRFPFLGSVTAGSISYRTTYAVLTQSLDDLASDSQKVLMKALENK
ncbi:immunity-related GTPase family Q protein-like isoform X2 [Protopterus annectens]|nr:immunity-related GTPase family Q protein-like isoform X2 [Protopterus annectens]XP_043936779.1 immunity-related GTPase family Q protein-like isoform X2 [Protopterus annectens]